MPSEEEIGRIRTVISRITAGLEGFDPADRASIDRAVEAIRVCIPVISDTRSDRSRTSVPADPGHSASDAVVRSLGWVRSATSSFGC